MIFLSVIWLCPSSFVQAIKLMIQQCSVTCLDPYCYIQSLHVSGVWTQCNNSSNSKVKPKVVESRQVRLVFEFGRAACGVWIQCNNSSNHNVKPEVIESRLVQLVFEFHRGAGFEHSDAGEKCEKEEEGKTKQRREQHRGDQHGKSRSLDS